MSRWLAAGLVACAAGCGTSAGMFVRDARIEGYELVLERCEIFVTDKTIDVGTCTTERRPLPVTGGPGMLAPSAVLDVQADAEPTPTLTREQIRAGITPVRAAVVACGATAGYHGAVKVRLVIDDEGRITEIHPDAGGTTLAACIDAALAPASFAPTARGVTATVRFDLP